MRTHRKFKITKRKTPEYVCIRYLNQRDSPTTFAPPPPISSSRPFSTPALALLSLCSRSLPPSVFNRGMASINENAPSWADQWGTTQSGSPEGNNSSKSKSKESSNKKLADVKAAASVTMDKAKSVAAVGAQKVKSGTSMGIKWVKTQYQKRSSK